MFLKPNGQDWAWRYYDSFWAWLRHGLIIKWRCAQCGKRHISSIKYWDDHIWFDVPLCTRCQDEAFIGYNETMARLAALDEELGAPDWSA